ncbi:MAG: PA2169 family four-helix-bundle protein [Vicinamibacterales bacterium]
MPDHSERWLLNRLIEMCRDEELTLRYVADHVKAPEARAFILDLASRRSQFAADLAPHAQRLGGPGATDGTTRGTLHRRWMAIRHTLTGFNDSAMVNEVIEREDEAAAAYDEALSEMLPPTSRDLIEAQRAEIRLAHDRAIGTLMH